MEGLGKLGGAGLGGTPDVPTKLCERGAEEFSLGAPRRETRGQRGWEVTDLLLKRSRIALKEVYDVVCEGRIVGRIMLANVLAPCWSWTLAYSFHEGRTPTRGQEATIEAAMHAFEKSWRKK